jgi:hypothetical protein
MLDKIKNQNEIGIETTPRTPPSLGIMEQFTVGPATTAKS